MKRREKGTGSIRKRTDGSWEGRYLDSTGKRKSVYGSSKTEVKEKLEKLTYVHNLTQFDDVGGDVELSLWFDHYIEIKTYQVKQQSIDQIKSAFYNHIEPVIGKKRLCNINTNDIARTISSIKAKELSKTTILNIMAHMRAMFNFAWQEGIIPRNPMFTTKNEWTRKTTRRALTPEEIKLIFTFIRNRDYQFYIMLCTMLLTGVRPGELCGIKWESFNDDFTSISITESITNKVYDRETKTEYSIREVPLAEFLSNEFKKQYEYLNKPKGYVFLNKHNNTYSTQYVDTRFKRLKNELEEIAEINLGKITPHYLRHTFATVGVHSGVDITNMADLLGHANYKTLLSTYAHADIKHKAESINKISKNMAKFIQN